MSNPQSHKIVINHEEQYSIWPADRPVSGEWRELRISGTEPECKHFIEEIRRRGPSSIEDIRRRLGG